MTGTGAATTGGRDGKKGQDPEGEGLEAEVCLQETGEGYDQHGRNYDGIGHHHIHRGESRWPDQAPRRAMDWMVVEEAEHAFLDQLQMELGIVVRWMRPVQEDPAGKLEYGSQDEEMEFYGDVRWGQR